MNLIEKRKSQLKILGTILLALGVIIAVTGVILIATCGFGKDISVLKLIFGIVLIILGLAGFGFGISFTWIASSVKATNGSIAEDILGKGTANMHKCENCGVQVEEGTKICKQCEENLKP